MRVILAFFTFLFTLASCDLSWKNCGTAEDLLDIQQLTYAPLVPVRGEALTVTAQGNLKEQLTSGTKVNLVVKWGFVRVPVPPVDVCGELSKLPDAPATCPLQPGPVSLTQSFVLPAQIPDGDYDVNIRIKNQDGRQVACVQVKLDF